MRLPAARHWFLFALLAPLFAWGQGAVVQTGEVRAELVAHAPQGVAPGKPLWLGLLIRHAPQWHTYWKNPGDSGLPTTLEWQLPVGVSAGTIEWPTPQRLPIGPLVNYGYEGTLLLVVPLTVAADFRAASLGVKVDANWLVCKEQCIPQSGKLTLGIPASASSVAHADLFAAAKAALPRQLATVSASAQTDGPALLLDIRGLPAAMQGKPVDFFAENAGVIDHAAALGQRWSGGQLALHVSLSAQRSASPAAMQAVVAVPGKGPGVALHFAVARWPDNTAAAVAPAAQALAARNPPAAPAPVAGSGVPMLVALLFAFIGGLLLNLMPCVFPVLSLKVLGFARQAANRRQLAAGGLAYTVGVVLSFVALASALLALRAGGDQLGWGFQLQSPLFVAALALLFALIGLNLLGVFEIGSVLPSRLAALQARHPLVDHGLTGVLAVAVASPCTAPFMGAALGVALTQPVPHALAVFAVLGAGMAAPYLGASLWPGLARLLPRPGAWMVHFKTAMAFPMFATVVWLVWVLGHQAGIDGAAVLLGLLVAVAFLAWVVGSGAMGKTARATLAAAALAIVLACAAWAWRTLQEAPAAASLPANTAGARLDARWQRWSPEAMARAQATGRPVFVDFTAAWCVTCQVNKRTTLGSQELLAAFDAQGVQLLRADWTRRDAAITVELARLGRTGVPVYALYAPGAREPQLLSEILTVGEVLDAMAPARSLR